MSITLVNFSLQNMTRDGFAIHFHAQECFLAVLQTPRCSYIVARLVTNYLIDG
jgi:hypothetical protein